MLTACDTAATPPASRPPMSDPVCDPAQSPDGCLESVRLALQSAFMATAARGVITRADYERIVGSVVSDRRLRGTFSYALLTVPQHGADDSDAAPPTQFRVAVEGARGTWWMCPPEGRVRVDACDHGG